MKFFNDNAFINGYFIFLFFVLLIIFMCTGCAFVLSLFASLLFIFLFKGVFVIWSIIWKYAGVIYERKFK